jgi:predicted AlkP superfamily phosphohydrolase/phosphomutase
MKTGGVLVIGLDGGTMDILRPLARRGTMPALAGLFDRGRSGTLRSTLPWYTIPGWASMNTGVAPGRHGLLHWTVADPSEYFENRRRGRRFVSSADLAYPTFWDVAGAAGKRVAVLNMPMTYPAWPVNGTMVTGFLTPDGATDGVSHPAGVLSAFPQYGIEPASSLSGDVGDSKNIDIDGYLRELTEITDARGEVASALIAPDDVDLGVVVFVGPDRVAHKVWPDLAVLVSGSTGTATGPRVGAVEAYFVALDRAIGRLIAVAGPRATVMLVSDHGFGPPPRHTFAVNAWLREQGYLRVRAAKVQQSVAKSPALRRMVGAAGKRLRKKRSGEYAGVDWSRSMLYGVRFPRTRVFGLVINRAGVKREGIVSEADAGPLLARVREDLASLRDADGAPVVRSTYSRDELGATAPGFPDLLVETEEAFDPIDGLRSATLFGTFDEPSGLHELEGLFGVCGPSVRDADDKEDLAADILDIGPTVLGLLGIRAPAHFEGTLRDDLLNLPELANPPDAGTISFPGRNPQPVPVTDKEEGEIEAHLESLGYLD